MSTERLWVIGLPAEASFVSLVDDVRSAANRASKADPGDRLDIARFEALATRLEQAALNQANAPRVAVGVPDVQQTTLLGIDPDSWPSGLPEDIRAAAMSLVAERLLPVLVVDPHVRGATGSEDVGAAEEPANVWPGEDGVFGGRAVEARFRAQIREALNPDATRRVPVSPSGINNAVVAEILREFVAAEPGATRVDAPVEYRDGSKSAHPFPLRALPLVTELPTASLSLKFALLSIRHTEMDAIVHGAWLRNAEISRPRPAAQTDDLVYDLSLRQLEELTRIERHVHLHMYQTGLETAVVGFYRALTTHLLKHPGSVSVQPMYFVTPPKPRKDNNARQPNGSRGSGGTSNGQGRHQSDPRQRNADRGGGRQQSGQAVQSDSPTERKPLLTESSTFRKGTVWST
ncbi:MAG TPA: hypothetical protein VGB75_06035 [Jatrophihabitans sp.]|jgi:hypothetical protein|uniref:hypothetical protein n=1 Tax=Jatrophihabitans sp. TaxID=1932789 RepID=UPI002EFDD013